MHLSVMSSDGGREMHRKKIGKMYKKLYNSS